MRVEIRKIKFLLLFIQLISCSCKFDKEERRDLNGVEDKIVNKYNNTTSYEKIDSLIANGFPYMKKEFDLNDYSSEGGILESYSNEKGHLVKVKATYFGHSGKSEWHYYFKNDTLFFVYKQEYRYKYDILSDKDVIIDSISSSEYFLERGNLIKWVDENKFVIDEKSEKFIQEDSYLKQDVNEFRRKIKVGY